MPSETNSASGNDNQRVARLRESVLRRKISRHITYQRIDVVAAVKSLRASEQEPSWQLRRGYLVRDILSSVVFDFDELDLLAGRIMIPGDSSSREWIEAQEYLSHLPVSPGQTGHCELDLQPLMQKGIRGLQEDIAREAEKHSSSEDANERKKTYESFIVSLQGLSRLMERAAEDAELAGLRDIVQSCRHISNHPPESFRDAVQLLWLTVFAVMHSQGAHLVAPGHLDRILYPFYERDIREGRLTRNEALELIECLYLLINDYIQDNLAIPVMVGGRDAQGNDVTNDLSYLCLEALRKTRLSYPTVGICWHEGTPEGLTNLAIELMADGCPTPAFFGDETIQAGLKSYGVPADQACNYINSTCVEITPSFSSNVWVASPYFSVCKMLLEEIDAQVLLNGSAAQSFNAFLSSYVERLSRAVKVAADVENHYRRQRNLHGRKPLQSVFTRDCIARGRDIDDGGALYNWVECSFVGLANLADSLQVISSEVFDEKRVTLSQIKTLLDKDFDGEEPVRQRFLRKHAKYGNDNAEVDALFAQFVDVARAECGKHKMEPDASPFVPGAFCWIMHQLLGSDCGATPDGRKARTPFADGCGPAQGRETSGPTASILSTTSWQHSPMLGGLAYNMKFSHTLMQSPGAKERLRDLILTFLRRGGFETQVNVVDSTVLRKAKENPEAYQDLVVRIGGYTDYFARLSPAMQDEIIMRTEFTDVG